MKFSRLDLRLARVTMDASVGDGVTAESLGEAIRLALIQRLRGDAAQTTASALPPDQVGPLGNLIATSIAGRIESGGGGNDGR